MRISPPEPDAFDAGGVESWVFDLDNTLYPARCNLFVQIDQRMGEYISAALSVDMVAAKAIQKTYFRQYGTTLCGLMRNHRVDPVAYMDFVHDIDLGVLTPDAGLAGALGRLDGPKFVFTNGSVAHAARVLDRLGIAGHFADVFDIAAADYVPKPNPAPYDRMLARFGIAAPSAVLVEDTLANLAPAAARGMTTLWVRHGRADLALDAEAEMPDHVHHVTDDLSGWLAAVAARLPAR